MGVFTGDPAVGAFGLCETGVGAGGAAALDLGAGLDTGGFAAGG